jgi:CheY-like chemotaxis protein
VLIAALTGWGQEDHQARAQEAGFDRHLVKPTEPAQIQALLTDAARRQS